MMRSLELLVANVALESTLGVRATHVAVEGVLVADLFAAELAS